MTDRLADLSSRGVSIWLDDLSRDRLTSGSLADLVARDHVAGVTTNPTIFAKAISGGGEAYAGQLHDLWARGTCVHEALRDMTTHDVRWACDVLRPRSPTPGWLISTTRRCSRRRAGPRWPRPGPGRSGRCGPRPRSRTRPTPTPCT